MLDVFRQHFLPWSWLNTFPVYDKLWFPKENNTQTGLRRRTYNIAVVYNCNT